MKDRSKAEALTDSAMSMIPFVAAVYHGRKNHKEGFTEASTIYEKKFADLKAEMQQFRIDVLGEEQMLICPQAWDSDFWQKKLEVFIKERYEQTPSPRDLILDFIQFCIDTFPKRRLAQTLEDLKTIRTVISADSQKLANTTQEDIQLTIDFLSFYKDVGEVKNIKQSLVALLPNTKGCNFLVLGKTGVGKSSLLNCLLGDRRFDTGTGRPVTTKGIHESEGTLDGIRVRVFDSWGLEAGAVEEWHRMLKDAQEKHDLTHKIEDWFHAVVYCVNAGGHRIEDVDRDIIRSLLADDLYVVVALTQSDLCSEADAQILRNTLCSSNECEKLLPRNVIETCAGGKTRGHESEPFGIQELKRAILENYKKTIKAQLPARCIYLAQQKVDMFRKEMEKWIDSREWKYDENENNRPLKQKCDEFANAFLKKQFPEIVREEIVACSQYGRNLATVLQFDDVADLVPEVPPDMSFWESVGNWFVKTFKFLNPFGKTDPEEEQDRLRYKVNKFCDGILTQVEQQRTAIEKKVREVLK